MFSIIESKETISGRSWCWRSGGTRWSKWFQVS